MAEPSDTSPTTMSQQPQASSPTPISRDLAPPGGSPTGTVHPTLASTSSSLTSPYVAPPPAQPSRLGMALQNPSNLLASIHQGRIPLHTQLGGHAGLFSTNLEGSLVIKRSTPREIAFYLYLQSLARELALERREAEQLRRELGRGLNRVKGMVGAMMSSAGLAMGSAGQVVESASQVAMGQGQKALAASQSAGMLVGGQIQDLAARTTNRWRSLTLPGGIGPPSSVPPMPLSPVKARKATAAGSPFPDLNFDGTPGGAMPPSPSSTTYRLSQLFSKLKPVALAPTAVPIQDGKVGFEPEEELKMNENAARKEAEKVALVDPDAAASSSGAERGQEETKEETLMDGKKRAETMLFKMKSMRVSKGKGKAGSPSISSVASVVGESPVLVDEPDVMDLPEGGEAKEAKPVPAEPLPPTPVEKVGPAVPVKDDESSGPAVPEKEVQQVDQRELLARLIAFLPRFYGTLKVEENEGDDGSTSGQHYESIVIQNLLHPFTNAAALDIKLGTILYDPATVDDAKKEKMVKKAESTTSAKLGVKLSGFETWNDITKEPVLSPRSYGYSLTAEQLPEAMAKFFPIDNVSPDGPVSADRHRTNMVRVLSSLLVTLEVFKEITSHLEVRFVGTSFLIAYEGNPTVLNEAWKAADKGLASKTGLATGQEPKPDTKTSLASASDSDSKAAKALKDSSAADSDAVESRLTEDAAEFEMATSEASFFSSSMDDEDTDVEDGSSPTPSAQLVPFQIRLIDFAHTRLAPGEGPDESFLTGVNTFIRLVRGRMAELTPA